MAKTIYFDNLNDLLIKLAEIGISSILVEGGAKLISSFLVEKLYDRVSFYIGPLLIGNGKNSFYSDEIEKMCHAIKFKRKNLRILDGQFVFEGSI